MSPLSNMVPFINGVVGVVLTAWIGRHHFGFNWEDVILALVGACVGAVVSGVLTLELERIRFMKATLMRRWPGTWFVLLLFYNGTMVAIAPRLRDWETFWALWLPLTLTTGLVLGPVLGRIRDFIVQARQRREQLQSSRPKSPVL